MEKIGSEIHFLKDNLSKQLQIYHHYETRANYTLALSSAILLFAITILMSKPAFALGLYVIIFTTFVALVFSLLTLKPPKIMRKKRQEESLFYHNNINGMSLGDFTKKIEKTFSSSQEIVKQYSLEIYNLATYSISPRRIFSVYTALTLVIGLTIGIILILIKIL